MRYPVKESAHSSHALIANLLGPGHGRTLLDVGCADGQVAERFLSLGWNVTGIEPFARDAALARTRGIEIIEMGIEEALDHIEGRFHAVVLGDVLEHVPDPWAQLSRLRGICRPDAHIIISIPNIAHAFVRGQLLIGRFDYQDRGILDRTHLRFFTRRTARELVISAGLVCEEIHYSPTPVEIVIPRLLSTAWGRGLLRANAGLARMLPTLLGYQMIMSCRVLGEWNADSSSR